MDKGTKDEEEDRRRRTHRVRLRNPRYCNDVMINITISKEDFPELQEDECNQPKKTTEEDVAMSVLNMYWPNMD